MVSKYHDTTSFVNRVSRYLDIIANPCKIETMAPREWYAVNIRMPQVLRKALRRLSYLTEVSTNQIMVETLAHHLGDYPIGEKTGEGAADWKFIPARSDAEVENLLKEAIKETGSEGFYERLKREGIL